MIRQRVENAVKVYIDGGYRNNGEYHTGLLIGNDFIPLQCAIFVLQEVPELKSIDFHDTVKNFDETIYASEFSPISYEVPSSTSETGTEIKQYPSPNFDAFNNKLVGDYDSVCQSDIVYVTNQTSFESDNDGYLIQFIQDDKVVLESRKSHFKIDADVDIYGSVIKLTAKKDNASISKIVINGISENIDDYNAHIKIDDESICVCRDVNIEIE